MTTVTRYKVLKILDISKSSLYYQYKREITDLEIKNQIESVLVNNPAYGHRRIALELKVNKKSILRVMNKYGIKPYRRRRKPWKKNDINKEESKYVNKIKDICAVRPNIIWVSDFTYIKYQGRFIYLATIIDQYTREVVGTNIMRYHTSELVTGALIDAISKHGRPEYLHSDQGSEYDSQKYTDFAEILGIEISMSAKGSPWENGYQESFYAQMKLEVGDLNRYETFGELVASLYEHIDYYNYRRIHTALKMAPVKFKEKWYSKLGT